MKRQDTIFVIDTSALMGKGNYMASDVPLATTPALIDEMVKRGLQDVIRMLIAAGKMQVLEPSQSSISKVESAASDLGDLQYLSEPDLQLLALALDLTGQGCRAIIITDDYSIQNVAQQLSIGFRSASERGIREMIRWETYCPGCWKVLPNHMKGDTCPHCGTPLKRRAVKKKPLKENSYGTSHRNNI